MNDNLDKNIQFWNTWQKQSHQLSKYCLKLLNRHTEDAEDALSLAAIKAHESFCSGQVEIRNINAWLYTITRNCCMDVHRSRDRRFTRFSPVADFEDFAEMLIDENTPEESLIGDDVRSTLFSTYRESSMLQQKVVYMRLVRDRSHKEIGTLLGMTSESSRKHLEAFRKRFRINLALANTLDTKTFPTSII